MIRGTKINDRTNIEPTMEELMRSSFDEYGIDGSPFVFPAVVRRVVAWIVSWHPALFAIEVWFLHRLWGLVGRHHSHPVARSWAELAWQHQLRDALGLARSVAALDQHPTFQQGCRELGFRNCLEAMFYRGAFLDPFFKQGKWPHTSFTDPVQQPQYFVPGIPSQRFYDPADFEWTAWMEDAYKKVQAEVFDLLNIHRDQFGMFRPELDTDIKGWNTFIFYVNGRRQEESCRRAPQLAALADRLLEHEEGELTMLSVLNPHSHIPPHVGPLNGILRAHLPILVPPDCGLRVGGETVGWEEGKVLVFDDSFVHNVWNDSDNVRIVLFFNIWHPCLSQPEREALANLRCAYNDTPVGRKFLKRQEAARPSTVVVNTKATSSATHAVVKPV